MIIFYMSEIAISGIKTMINEFKNKPHWIGVVCFCITFLVVLGFFSWFFFTPFFLVFRELYSVGLKGGLDNFLPGTLIAININHFFYIIIILCAWFSVLLSRMLSKDSNVKNFKKIFAVAALACFVVSLSSQTSALFNLWLRRRAIYDGLTLEQRLHKLHTIFYEYAQECKRVLPGYHKATLITDMNMDEDPGMYYNRVLSYLLFPIDIINFRQGPQECLVIFDKENPRAFVPPHYRIIFYYGDKCLLAVKVKGDQS